MEIKINGNSDSTDSLNYLWLAIFKNGEKIFQFDENGIEHKFSEVLGNYKDLKFFILYNKNTDDEFIVNLENGIISHNKIDEKLESEKKNIRLIYFRRVKIDFTLNGETLNTEIKYHLGCQWNDNEGKNYKTIIIIDQNGNWQVE